MPDAFTYTPPEPLTIDFSPPVKSGDLKLERLVLREPSSNQVWFAEQHLTERNGNKGPRLYQRALVAKNANVPEAALDAIPIGAFQRAADYLQKFVTDGLEADGSEGEGSLCINFDPPLKVGEREYTAIVVEEPTIGQMVKADTALGDMSPQRVRQFQQNLVSMACGENLLVPGLPISALNRAATFCMGFTRGGRAT